MHKQLFILGTLLAFAVPATTSAHVTNGLQTTNTAAEQTPPTTWPTEAPTNASGPSTTATDANTERPVDPITGNFYPPLKNLSVLLGHTLYLEVFTNIAANIPSSNWGRSRQWDPTRGDRLSHGGDCSIHPSLADRLVRCDDMLVLRGVTYQDAGLYWFKTYSGPMIEKIYFNVKVFESQPVLAPIGLHYDRLDVQCYDLKNPEAQLNLEIMEDHHNPGFKAKKIKLGIKDSWTLAIANLEKWGGSIWDCYYQIWARCVSTFLNTQTETTWRHLKHKTHLGSRWARGRPWCAYRGSNQLKHIKFDWSHQGPLPQGKCYRRYFSASDPIIAPCQHVESHIYTIAEARNFKVKRPLGGVRVVSSAPIFTLRPQLNDSGYYLVTNGTDVLRTFEMRVQPTLYVSVDLIKQQNDGLFLNCTHNGGPEGIVSWEVEGVYGYFLLVEGRDYQAILYHDCWKNWDEWFYKVGVRCRVRAGFSAAESRWFLAKGTRDPYH